MTTAAKSARPYAIVNAGTSRALRDAPHRQPKNCASDCAVDCDTSIEAPSTQPPAPNRKNTIPVFPKLAMAIRPGWLRCEGEIEAGKKSTAPPKSRPIANTEPSE